ncbi:MAG: DUF4367 domain-containing protein [Oscillospiraceae bacterium]|nr:DUF4367 domain-containing protein [Oscillospiraceae bacterium]
MAMNDSSELILEALLKAGASASDGAFMQKVDELDAEIPDAPPSKERDKKLRRLLRRVGRRERRRGWTTVGRVAAAALIIVLAGLGIMTVGVDAIRSAFLNFVLDEGSPNTEYNFTGKETHPAEDYELYPTSGQYELSYVPEGFELVDKDLSNEKHTYYQYESSEGDWFGFHADPLEGSFGVDTEDSIVDNITINGYNAVFISNTKRNSIVWHNSYNAFTLSGNIVKDEMIKIAENVEMVR